MRRKSWFLLAVFLFLVLPLSADTLRLKNRTVLEGYFVGGSANGVTFIDTSGVSKTYPLSEIESMSYGAVSAPAPQAPAPPQKIEVPVGTILFVTMSDTLDTSSAFVGQRFTGTLAMDLAALGSVVARKGTVVYGDVVDTESAHRFRGKSELKIQLTQIVIQGNSVPIVTNVFDTEGKSSGRRTFRRLLGGAGLGAAFGAIGGNAGMGAAIGAASGAFLAVVQKGDQVQIPAEGQIQFRLQQPVSLPVVH
ncbi:MAG TPA: hypothetical protein VMT75_01630 [Candidatus Saccharimonadales bacterium]|nr:hypothetical protein [Candidatus Saccharimonadales bacterium]